MDAKVFISYSRKDKATIVDALYHYLVKRSENQSIWYDTEAIHYGDSVPWAASAGLSNSDIFLILISHHYLESEWCKRELNAIISLSIDDPMKRMLVIRIGKAAIPEIICDIHYLEIDSTDPEDIHHLNEMVAREIERLTQPSHLDSDHYVNKTNTAQAIVSMILDQAASRQFGNILLNPMFLQKHANPEFKESSFRCEGIILIKPGGTFYEPCLLAILNRIISCAEIMQVKVFNGPLIDRDNLFDEQYVDTMKIASGDISLNDEDFQEIANIYDTPEFEDVFGVPYCKDLVVPALKLVREDGMITENELSDLWEQGRNAIFDIRDCKGINKIGYQKTVYPIKHRFTREPDVRIVLNGFVPGFKRLFTSPEAITIALHVSTQQPWNHIRENIVGGKSNPQKCEPGSIRRLAFEGKIPLAPEDNIVNGQRNVCHASATLFDGMRELMIWFRYSSQDTVLGKLLTQNGIQLTELRTKEESILPQISWHTRDALIGDIVYTVLRRMKLQDIHGSNLRRDRMYERYAQMLNVALDKIKAVRHHGFMSFIENGLRLEIGGERLFMMTLIRLHFEENEDVMLFADIVEDIKSLAMDQKLPVEVLSEAYLIAASDMHFLRLPEYGNRINRRGIFRLTVLYELSQQAVECAKRVQKNMLKDLQAILTPSNACPAEVMTIAQTPEWKEYCAQQPLHHGPKTVTPVVALILAGGRSTRMHSTIPKPVLPFRDRLLFNHVKSNLMAAFQQNTDCITAIGFRSKLVRYALGDQQHYHEYQKTPGLAFRVAAVLEAIKKPPGEEQKVVLTYTDMPLVSSTMIRKLADLVDDKQTFGMMETHQPDLSGHILKESGQIKAIIQKRSHPLDVSPAMTLTDVGVYVFYNTAAFRDTLISINNCNARGEFIFADVVKELAGSGWNIRSIPVDTYMAASINTTNDLLRILISVLSHERSDIKKYYDIELPDSIKTKDLSIYVQKHYGSFFNFIKWEEAWS